jgi:hypothetical protein
MIDLNSLQPGDLIHNDVLDETKLVISINFDHYNSIYNILWCNEFNEIMWVKFSNIYAYRWFKIS